MAQNEYLRPKGTDTSNLDRRKHPMNGQFYNPPYYMDRFGGFTSAAKGCFESNKMTLEKSGPQAVRGRPI